MVTRSDTDVGCRAHDRERVSAARSGYDIVVIEPQRQVFRDSALSNGNGNETAETVIALGRRIYRFCRPSPELLAFDPSTLWGMIFEAAGDDEDARRLLAKFKDTSTWAMAVLTAKLVHEVYEAGGLDEVPA